MSGACLTAFDLAIALMDRGEICELYTESRFAYGSLGRLYIDHRSLAVTTSGFKNLGYFFLSFYLKMVAAYIVNIIGCGVSVTLYGFNVRN